MESQSAKHGGMCRMHLAGGGIERLGQFALWNARGKLLLIIPDINGKRPLPGAFSGITQAAPSERLLTQT